MSALLLCMICANAGAAPVRIAGVSHLGDLPTFVAAERGLFTRAGIEARVSRVPNGRLALERLRAGTADFALMALTPLVLDRLADDTPNGPEDPVILASIVQSAHLNQIATLDDRGIREPADLAGRRLGLTRGTNAEFHWWLFARFHGIDPAAVEIVDLEKNALGDALEAGRVDTAVLWQPWTARLRASVGNRLHTFEHGALYDAHWVLATRRATAEDRPRLCADIIRAYADADAAIAREPAAVLERFYTALGLGDAMPQPAGYPYGFNVELGWSVLVGLGQQFDWAATTGRGDTTLRPSILAMMAPGPLRRAAPGAVNVAADLLDAGGTP